MNKDTDKYIFQLLNCYMYLNYSQCRVPENSEALSWFSGEITWNLPLPPPPLRPYPIEKGI